MRYEERPAPADLRAHVQALWVVEGEVGELIRVTPDGCTDLIALDDRATRLLFVGPMTRARVVPLRGPRTVGVQLRPGTLALIRPDLRLRSLRDRDLVLSGLPAAGDPLNALIARVRAMACADELRRSPDVDRVLDAMAEDGAAPLSAIYGRLELAERTVQRLFNRFVGLTPKQTATVLRQRRVTRVLRAGAGAGTSMGNGANAGDTGGLATLASSLGYADQAHLTRDFRTQVGLAPGQYRSEIRGVDFVQDARDDGSENRGDR